MASITATADAELTAGGSPTGEPAWLALEPEPVYVVLHSPARGSDTGHAALLLPTFGWDDDCSYRRRRDWATQLAERGITTARFDFPGREDSAGSPTANGRAESWVAATAEVARWLRAQSGAQRLTAIGIGIGGLIAYKAVSEEAPIDDLVLWGARASGRAHVRQWRAYAALAAEEGEADHECPDGALGIGGHTLSAGTAATLSAIDPAKLTLPRASARRVLLIGRDSHGIDAKLQSQLEQSGVELTTLESDEYQCLVSPPDLGLTPAKTVRAANDWIAEPTLSEWIAPPASARAPDGLDATPARATGEVTLEHDGVLIRERTAVIESSMGKLRGIISEPVTGPRARICLLTGNSGALRHTGPGRIFVELARGAAAAGIPAARFDLPGLGDSDGIAVPSFERTEVDDQRTLAAFAAICDQLEQQQVADRFVTAGLSLGGYLAVRAAVSDRRVIGALPVNTSGLVWSEKQRKRVRKDVIAVSGPDALSTEPEVRRMPPALRRLADRVGRLLRTLDALSRRRLARSDLLWRLEHRREFSGLDQRLGELAAKRAHVRLLLSENEQLLRMFERPKQSARLARSPTVKIDRLPGQDHLLRPLWIQEIVLERMLTALREIAGAQGREAG